MMTWKSVTVTVRWSAAVAALARDSDASSEPQDYWAVDLKVQVALRLGLALVQVQVAIMICVARVTLA